MTGGDRARVGVVVMEGRLEEYRGRLPDLVGDAERLGVDRLVVGDHVSFRGGFGLDGLIQAAGLLALSRRLEVQTGVYLLPLRHPVLVARQLVSVAALGPGRFSFGVGIGGEDAGEFSACGVDPRTRGRRTDESLGLIQRLLAGEKVDHDGPYFPVRDALIEPSPDPAIPVIVGGRSDAALRRTARFGAGWIGVWLSARRYAEAVGRIDEFAAAAGRERLEPWLHTMQMWAGFGPARQTARDRIAPVMESLYGQPFESFEKYTPYGTPQDIVDGLLPYWQAGCRSFNFTPSAGSLREALEGAAEIRERLGALP